MNWTVTNKHNVKHYIVVQEAPTCLEVNIVRTSVGTPLKIMKEFNKDIPFSECITKIENLCNLDNDIYSMISLHQKEES